MSDPYRTHVALLTAAVKATTGPVIEFGQGPNSTPLLDALCGPERWFVSLETAPEWYRPFAPGGARLAFLLTDYDRWYDLPWPVPRFAVCLIDQAPTGRRRIDLIKMRPFVDLFVIHDTESPTYEYGPLLASFPYRHDDKAQTPWTTVVGDYQEPFDKLAVALANQPGEIPNA